MEAFEHPLCNAVLGPPQRAAHVEGLAEEHVSALPVQRGALVNDPCVRSFWKPTAGELGTLVQGGCVVLCVLGTTHAPLRLDVLEREGAAAMQDAASEFEVTTTDGGYATATGPREIAYAEAMRYAEAYASDGETVQVYEIKRTLMRELR